MEEASASRTPIFRRHHMHQETGQVKLLQSFLELPMRRVIFVMALIVIVFSSAAGRAQSTTSAISGSVADSSGAVVVGATVSVVNTATGVAYHTTTNSLGAYHVTQLPPGSYTMEVSKAGFETQNVQSFQLFVDQQFQQNITLAVGQATQTITVSADALLLDTQTSNQGQVIENQQIDNMPLNGRDVLQLAQLSAGVTPVVSGMSSPASQWTGTATVAVVIGGLREDDASYLYDGIETRNAWYGAAGLLPSPDFTQEFKVEQSGSSAAYGDGGAFINVVTRSGTNGFHGSAYEYIRNNDFDARNYFDQGAAPPFHQNQFGASFGGPIKKNKMFFFGNYEGFRQIFPQDEFANVPTAAQLAGNFSSDSQQLVNPFDIVNGAYQPFPGNQIPSSLFNATAQKVLALYPTPNGLYPSGQNYHYVSNTTDNWDQENVRFDYTISHKDSVFVRFTNQNQTTNVTDITPSREIIYPSNPKNLAVGWTHSFSPNLVNNVRYGWSHTAVGEQRADGYNASDANPLGLINEVDQPGSYGPPSIGVTNYANPGSTEGTDIVREGMNMWTESLLYQKGRHQITGGLDIRYQPIFMYEDWAATNISFNGSYTGDPIGDLLLGVPNNGFTALGDPTMNLRMWYQSYYVQDNIQLSHRLSVNIGGRWEHAQQPIELNNRVGSFDLATNQDLTYPDTNVLGLTRAMVKPIYTNFSPRLGFNWTPFANTDVKGGFGIYYLQPNINQYEVEVDTTKLYLIQSYGNAPIGKPLNYTLNQLFGSTVPGGGPTASFIQPNGHTPYTYEWNLSIDHTLRNWLLEVSYLGSAAHHYEERPNLDPENPDGTYPLTGWNGVQENSMSGSSFYSGLVARVEKRYSSGFSLMGSYTFSKCLGWPWQDVFSWHPLDMDLDRGHCQEDMNQNVVANTIYELPFGHGKAFLNSGTLNDVVFGGWKVAAIAALHSGPWETLGSNQSLGIFVNGLPNVTGPVNNSSLHGGLGKHGKLGPYFNTQNVVPVTAVGTQGNSSVQSISSPGSADWDLSGDKTWKFAEQYGLTFRADVFNAFNRVNFYGLDTGVNDSKFGYVQSANAAREIQLSLRFEF
jgi:hypothetical protein